MFDPNPPSKCSSHHMFPKRGDLFTAELLGFNCPASESEKGAGAQKCSLMETCKANKALFFCTDTLKSGHIEIKPVTWLEGGHF